MAEISLTTDGFLENTSIDPLNEDSHMETEKMSIEEEAALLSRNSGEDEEQENEIPPAQPNQERTKKTNIQPTEKGKVKQALVRQAVSSIKNQKNGKRPREEHEKSAKTAASSNTKKARQDDEQRSSIQEKINSSKQSIAKLQSHLEKGTCPKTLRYNVRANIAPDEDFKREIGSIRKKSE